MSIAAVNVDGGGRSYDSYKGGHIDCESDSPQLVTQLMQEAQKGDRPWCSYNPRPRVLVDPAIPAQIDLLAPTLMGFVEPPKHTRKAQFRNIQADLWHPSGRKSICMDDRSSASSIRYQRETGQVLGPQKGKNRKRIGHYSVFTLLDASEAAGIPVGTKLYFARRLALDVPEPPRSIRVQAAKTSNRCLISPVVVEQKQAIKNEALMTLNHTCGGTGPYVEFSQAGVQRGALVPSSRGVSFCSSSGDFAEWHQLLDPKQGQLEEGSVVGMFDGKVSLITEGASMCGVITRRAIVVGSFDSNSDARGALVAYCGRVPIRVRGPVKTGDALTPSGNGDGIAVRKNPSDVGPDGSCDSCPALGNDTITPATALLAVALVDNDNTGDEWSVSMVESSVMSPGWTPAMLQATYGRPQIRSIARVGSLVCLLLTLLVVTISMTSHLQNQPTTTDVNVFESVSIRQSMLKHAKTPLASMQPTSAQPDERSAVPSPSTSALAASSSKQGAPRTSMPSMQSTPQPDERMIARDSLVRMPLPTSTGASPNSKHEKSSAPSRRPLTHAAQARAQAARNRAWNATNLAINGELKAGYRQQYIHNTSDNATSLLTACKRKADSALAACKKHNTSRALAACEWTCIYALAACSQRQKQSTNSTVIKAPVKVKQTNDEFQCAKEYSWCSCNGRVRYGTGNTWSAFKTSTGKIACTNAVFGDVLKGVAKVCTCIPWTSRYTPEHNAVPNVSSAHDWFGLVRLKDQTARCMDGSLGAYYVAKAKSGSVHNSSWLIHLGNGGACNTKESCASRLRNWDATSKSYPAHLDMSSIQPAGLVGEKELSDWNRVHIPCCSQDLWTGQRTIASNKTWGMYFSGHRILAAVLANLNAQLGAATSIVLSGESAGGIGVWSNVDWLAAKYPHARVVGAPIGGASFLASPYYENGHSIDFQRHVWRARFERWHSFVDPDCALHHKGGQVCQPTLSH